MVLMILSLFLPSFRAVVDKRGNSGLLPMFTTEFDSDSTIGALKKALLAQPNTLISGVSSADHIRLRHLTRGDGIGKFMPSSQETLKQQGVTGAEKKIAIEVLAQSEKLTPAGMLLRACVAVPNKVCVCFFFVCLFFVLFCFVCLFFPTSCSFVCLFSVNCFVLFVCFSVNCSPSQAGDLSSGPLFGPISSTPYLPEVAFDAGLTPQVPQLQALLSQLTGLLLLRSSFHQHPCYSKKMV